MTFPLPTNQTGLLSLALYSNLVTDNLFGGFILLFVGIVVFLYTFNNISGYSVKKPLLLSTFVNVILAILFWIVGLINVWIFVLSIGLAFVAVLLNFANVDFLN